MNVYVNYVRESTFSGNKLMNYTDNRDGDLGHGHIS